MIYNFKGKNITIPDNEILRSMEILNLTKDEAIQLWLEDEGFLENETVKELTTKAKNNKTVKHEAKSDKPRKTVVRERKPDEEKIEIIDKIADFLIKNNYNNVQITNKSKIIEFNIGENHYKLDLVKQRPPKK